MDKLRNSLCVKLHRLRTSRPADRWAVTNEAEEERVLFGSPTSRCRRRSACGARTAGTRDHVAFATLEDVSSFYFFYRHGTADFRVASISSGIGGSTDVGWV
jgi:hypothetical protein